MIDFNPIMAEGSKPSESLCPPRLIPHPTGEYLNGARRWQGVPAIERTKAGRIFFAFYSGKVDEGIGNFVVLFTSDDDGKTMNEPLLAVVPEHLDSCRIFDPCLWFAPDGKLWFFVAQSYTYYDGRNGVWAMQCENFDSAEPTFSAPVRIANGIMMNKPLVVGGDWLLPCAIWDKYQSNYNDIPGERFSNVYRSKDGGKSFALLSHADYPDRFVDEHMIVELSDGRLMMLIRGKHGIGQAFSDDRGESWSVAEDSGLGGPCSRFFFRKLKSGRILLVNHRLFTRRNNLTAMISDDDAKTWKGFLMIDERNSVSYPDAVETDDGMIYLIYDRERYDAREILLAKFTEEDVLAGKITDPRSELRIVLNRATGEKANPAT